MSDVKKRVFVGMSGGVDSSVSAALLQKEGYEVVGVFIKVWQADFLPCTWREERRDAMRAAAHLGIPFLTLNLESEYKEEVVDYMIREYSDGRVPNPDVMCNKHVKFGAFLDYAKKNGADYIATGHYARIEKIQSESTYRLLTGVDKEKDQSYFLWTLTQDQLAHTLFPVGHLQKSEVRKLAKELRLTNAEKKDSQGLCFMGAVDMKDFLKHYIIAEEGSVLNEEGNIVGKHDGAMLYTIGERHGFHLDNTSAHEKPSYVTSKDIEHNTITIGSNTNSDASGSVRACELIKMNWMTPRRDEAVEIRCSSRIRYRGELYSASVGKFKENTARVELSKCGEYIAPGQSVVLYDGEICIGGGVIAK